MGESDHVGGTNWGSRRKGPDLQGGFPVSGSGTKCWEWLTRRKGPPLLSFSPPAHLRLRR